MIHHRNGCTLYKNRVMKVDVFVHTNLQQLWNIVRTLLLLDLLTCSAKAGSFFVSPLWTRTFSSKSTHCAAVTCERSQ